jgi:hypothetical protein
MMLIGFAGLGLSQDEEERGGVVNRGARDERSAIRRLQATMPGHQATPTRRGPGCLWAKAGSVVQYRSREMTDYGFAVSIFEPRERRGGFLDRRGADLRQSV